MSNILAIIAVALSIFSVAHFAYAHGRNGYVVAYKGVPSDLSQAAILGPAGVYLFKWTAWKFTGLSMALSALTLFCYWASSLAANFGQRVRQEGGLSIMFIRAVAKKQRQDPDKLVVAWTKVGGLKGLIGKWALGRKRWGKYPSHPVEHITYSDDLN